jgi:hypothetical protein
MLVRRQYEQLVYTLPDQYPSVRLSTLVLVPPGLDTARLTGLVTFDSDIVLCVYELLDFQQGVIEAYRYEVSRCHSPFTESPLPQADEYCRASYAGMIRGHIPAILPRRPPFPITSISHQTSNTIVFLRRS